MTAQRSSRSLTTLVESRASVDRTERLVWLWLKVVVFIGLVAYTLSAQFGTTAQPESLLVERAKVSKDSSSDEKPVSEVGEGTPPSITLLSPTLKNGAGPLGSYLLQGVTEPKAKVLLKSNGVRVGAVRADSKGIWKAKLQFETPGVRDVSATTLADGKASGEPAVLHLDIVRKATVKSVEGMSNYVAEKLEEASEPKFEPEPDMSGVFDEEEFKVLSHKAGQVVKPGRVVIEGTAQAGDKLHTFVNGKLRMKSTATADGKWDAPLPLKSPGTRTIKVLNLTQKKSQVLKLIVK